MSIVMWKFNILLLFFLLPFSLLGQESKLAQQYYLDGEYEKAATLFKKLFDKNNKNDYYFNKYIESMIALEAYDECEKIIKKQIKKRPKDVQLLVTYGNLYERQYKDEEAEKQYRKAIDKLPASRFAITKLANAFSNLTKYDLAIASYEKGSKLLKDKNIFASNLGDMYRRKGDTPKMIEQYLFSLKGNPGRLNTLKTIFQRHLLADEDYLELQAQLYERIQDEKDNIPFTELLTWVFIQKKDYRGALRQSKALDRKLDENGGRVYRLAEVAANDKDYDTAIQAYDYIVAEKGPTSGFYIEAKRESLTCKRKKLVEGYDYTQADLENLEQQYVGFLDEFGRNKTTATIIAELAELEAFYLNNLPRATALLKEMIEYPAINRYVQAKAKLSLADFYLMQGERWEATLLYSQVDKAFVDDVLGHEARYRNAKLSYFMGDFQWAQTQFDVLKASTSKLIANDALDLSVFIMDNMGLDTTSVPLESYARSELLIFQNRFPEAFNKLDSLKQEYPEHALDDDILYLKARVYVKERKFTEAASMYQEIIDKHLESIRTDNSMYALAQLYENQLNDTEKAKALYERIFTEFSGSTFAVESRKRFRKLRGDNLQ
ncbi:MAG: tetratricopeptide repeat protein [Bacteroidota bacterium]